MTKVSFKSVKDAADFLKDNGVSYPDTLTESQVKEMATSFATGLAKRDLEQAIKRKIETDSKLKKLATTVSTADEFDPLKQVLLDALKVSDSPTKSVSVFDYKLTDTEKIGIACGIVDKIRMTSSKPESPIKNAVAPIKALFDSKLASYVPHRALMEYSKLKLQGEKTKSARLLTIPIETRDLMQQVIGKDGKPSVDADGNPVMKVVKDDKGKPVQEVTKEMFFSISLNGEEIRLEDTE